VLNLKPQSRPKAAKQKGRHSGGLFGFRAVSLSPAAAAAHPASRHSPAPASRWMPAAGSAPSPSWCFLQQSQHPECSNDRLQGWLRCWSGSRSCCQAGSRLRPSLHAGGLFKKPACGIYRLNMNFAYHLFCEERHRKNFISYSILLTKLVERAVLILFPI
jgi:hypothetical protein